MKTFEWKKSEELVSYEDALSQMQQRVTALKKGELENLIWFLEHPPLYTKGTGTLPTDLLTPQFPVHETGRGGRITYHGPGQRVVYTVINLASYKRDIKLFVFFLEEWIIQTLKGFSVQGERRPDRIGVWVKTPEGDQKIGAVGVRLQHWITSHGVSLNVAPDLSHYQEIVPCGISNYGVTSLYKLGVEASMGEVDDMLQKTFMPLFTQLMSQ